MELSVRHNIMDITSIDAFETIKGSFHGNGKDVYFIRLLGTYQGLARDVLHMDDFLGEKMRDGDGVYKRIEGLPKTVSMAETNQYIDYYQKWIENGKGELWTKVLQKDNDIENGSKTLSVMLGRACKEAVDLYGKGNRQINSGIEKNFAVKLLFWFDFILDGLMEQWNEYASVKIVAENIVKRQEYLFFYMLTCIGFDVLLLQKEKDIVEEDDRLGLSKKYVLGSYSVCELPIFSIEKYRKNRKEEKKNVISADIFRQRDQYKKKKTVNRQENLDTISEKRKEKNFEELSLLAASVVLITIHDQKGEPVGSGSGIMIGRNGYILTNHHVLSARRFYSIRIENDEQIYETDEIIKYHSILDLAILRIDRRLNPIPVYAGKEKLVRGQRVVAIGSPLGLFNSVSDGIISGFRMINDVDMIQFTAPISQGSSGGAILNMYGEVIGISTAEINCGQNINLAMGYECINAFIQGFL